VIDLNKAKLLPLQEEVPDRSGFGAPGRQDVVCVFFSKNYTGWFLSCLVVIPPCHAWLSPLLVILTGSGKRRKILRDRAVMGYGPARFSRIQEVP
jgi:hypothetical protein